MAIEFSCPNCGRTLRAEERHEGKQTRCPACGSGAAIPAAAAVIPMIEDAIQEEPPRGRRAVRVDRAADPNACPVCGAALDPKAVLCIECGFDRRTGRTRTTKVRRFDRNWNTGQAMPGRIIGMFISAVTISLFFIFLIVKLELNPVFFGLGFLAVVVGSLVNLGTFSFLRLVRTKKGHLDLTQDSYIAFIPIGRATVDLEDCAELRLDATVGTDSVPGFTGLTTLSVVMCGGFLPGALWYAYRSNEVHMKLTLVGKRDRDTLTLYRGTDEELMRDIVSTLQEAAHLPLKR